MIVYFTGALSAFFGPDQRNDLKDFPGMETPLNSKDYLW